MKKHLLLLSLVYCTITVFGQTPALPNGNFESWTSSFWDYPQNYSSNSNINNFYYYHLPANVTKTTDAYHGTYAVQIETISVGTDTSFGYFLNGNPNGAPSTWTGGIPYNQAPTGIRGYFKYNVATADSATIIVAFSKVGVNIGTYLIPIGGIHNSYTLFNYAFTPALTQTPDSVMFGAISCKVSDTQQQPHGFPGSTLIIDSISFTGVSSQPALMNGDFESWQTQVNNSPNDWYTQFGGSSVSNVNQSTDAKAGLYAIELTTLLGSDQNGTPRASAARISTGYYPNNCNGGCNEMGGYPFANQIDTLEFWYKYAPSGNDSAKVYLAFKQNGVSFQGTGPDLHAASSYTHMQIPFSLWQVPDSVMIEIVSSAWNDTLVSFVGSDLIIDEMHFKSQPLTTGILNYKNENTITIFPNPSNGTFQLQGLGFNIRQVEIFNTLGEKIYSTYNNQAIYNIDISHSPKGIYFVKTYNGEKFQTEKIILR